MYAPHEDAAWVAAKVLKNNGGSVECEYLRIPGDDTDFGKITVAGDQAGGDLRMPVVDECAEVLALVGEAGAGKTSLMNKLISAQMGRFSSTHAVSHSALCSYTGVDDV